MTDETLIALMAGVWLGCIAARSVAVTARGLLSGEQKTGRQLTIAALMLGLGVAPILLLDGHTRVYWVAALIGVTWERHNARPDGSPVVVSPSVAARLEKTRD